VKPVKILFCFLLSTFLLSGQTITVGSLFNYSVGDSLVYNHYEYYNGQQTVTTIYRTVLQKSISLNQDTVHYTIFQSQSTAIPCYMCGFVVSSGIQHETHYNLNTPFNCFTQTTLDTCSLLTNTTYINSCGLLESDRAIVPKTTINGCTFERPRLECKIIEGVGAFGVSVMGWYPFPGSEDKIVAYHKAGQPSCGAIGTMPVTGIEEHTAGGSQRFAIFPNPASGFCNVLCSRAGNVNLRVELTTVLGELVLKEDLKDGNPRFNTADLRPGTYFVRVYFDGVSAGQRTLVVY
jgi:hypothetical protein